MLTPNRRHALGAEQCAKCLRAGGDGTQMVPCPSHPKVKRTRKNYRESSDQAKLVKHMRDAGELVIRMEQGEEREPWKYSLHIALGMEPGASDLLWVRSRGRVVFIECKALDGSPRDTQIAHHAVLRRMGHVVIVAYGHAALIAAYEEHKRNDP